MGIDLFPEAASNFASRVDAIYISLSVAYGLVALIIAFFLVRFALKYHRSKAADRSPLKGKTWKIELLLIGVPLVTGAGIFAWAAAVYFDMRRPPSDTMDIYIVGKQWMWYAQHPEGHREINTLHIPVNQPIRLIMTSQDVIHSFFIPAFRVKQDVLPGRYTTMWFTPTQPGRYHLFCAEYCGTDHSRMIGEIIVLEARDYQQWLRLGTTEPGAAPDEAPLTGQPMAQAGRELFVEIGCNTCHVPDSADRAPRLEGLFSREVRLRTGDIITADEHYIRESILYPNAKIVAGYPAPSLMPSYAGQISEQQLNELIEYIKALSPEDE